MNMNDGAGRGAAGRGRLVSALTAGALALGGAALSATGAVAHETVHSVGAVTWHAARYAGKTVTMKGYVLRRHKGYVLFSDEPGGTVSAHDLPVSGKGATAMRDRVEYRLTGRFVKGGLTAANGNPYHLVLTAAPAPVKR